MALFEAEELRRVMTDAGVSAATRQVLLWIARRVEERFDDEVERVVERLLKARDPMED